MLDDKLLNFGGEGHFKYLFSVEEEELVGMVGPMGGVVVMPMGPGGDYLSKEKAKEKH